MKQTLFIVTLFTFVLGAKAQDTSFINNDTKPAKAKLDISQRANDHFVIQYGLTGWGSVPDSCKPSGFSRHFNFYVMLDKPFKKDPHYSIGIGAGLGSDNVFFKDKYVNVKANSNTLPFDTTVNYKKFKLTTMYLDVPIEFRYAANPVRPDKGLKASIGVKMGLLLKAYTKGKDLKTSSGGSAYGSNYIEKEFNNKFFNGFRAVAIGRIGYGFISLSGSYSLTSVLKSGAGPSINPYTIGLTLSGL